MTSTIQPGGSRMSEAGAISDLHGIVAAQRGAFLRDTYPAAAERRERLSALVGMVLANRARMHEALRSDFGVHPEALADLADVLTTVGRAQFASERLEAWMEPSPRETDPGFHGSTSAAIHYQPKGVIGVISPWNFPFDLSLGPAVDMLAAGNRVVIKPSECTPACSELLREMVAAAFPSDLLAVVTGGHDVATAFSSTAWDHLLFTGGTEAGRSVALAAAANLTPVTLELGGKSPALLLDDGLDEAAVANIVGTKLLKNGQMCIAPDYCLVPRARIGDLVYLARRHHEATAPDYARGPDCTGIISERHLDRLAGLLEQAEAAGTEVVTLGNAPADRRTRQMPLSLVIDPAEDLDVMRQEVFGPILPVKPYDSLDEAIEYINGRDRPLGVYVFTGDPAQARDVVHRTLSGGACVNACGWQGAIGSLGFGGSGASGTGRHHGIDGFREFSTARGVVVRGDGGVMDAFLPPYGDLARTVIGQALGS